MTGDALQPGQATLPTPASTASFWHREPSRILLGHRTTAELPSEADVVIIGSGIAGAFAAHYLAEENNARRIKVVMLEAREACWGATGRNGGHCQPKIYTNPPHISRFELANYQNIRSLITENEIDCDWRDVDSCHGFTSTSTFAERVSAVNALRSLDSELGRMITVTRAGSLSPSLDDLRLGKKVIGAITQKNSASLWPYKLVSWILERLLSNNITDGQSTAATGILFNLQTTTPAIRLQLIDRRVWIVHTPRGMLTAKHILLATNAYSSYLLPMFSDLIVPVRGQMSSLVPSLSFRPGDGSPVVDRNSYGFYGQGKGGASRDDYLVQRPFCISKGKNPIGGELMFGGGRDHEIGLGRGISDDSEIDHQVARYLRMELNNVLDMKSYDRELEATYEWSGVMGFSIDDRPWVGQVPRDLGGGRNLWICAGFTGHGMPSASLCAKAVVQMMRGKHPNDVELPPEYQCSSVRAHISRRVASTRGN